MPFGASLDETTTMAKNENKQIWAKPNKPVKTDKKWVFLGKYRAKKLVKLGKIREKLGAIWAEFLVTPKFRVLLRIGSN